MSLSDPSTPNIPAIGIDEIKSIAFGLGYDDVGFTQARIPQEDSHSYQEWLKNGYHADLQYMDNPVRMDPQSFFPGAKTAIIFISYYKQPKLDFSDQAGLVASYARGRDYHHVHRKRLKKFIEWLESRCQQKGIARGFSDSAPIMEKALAVQANLGWLGKNTLLIHRKFGTFILLSGLLTTLEFDFVPDHIIARQPRCGTCTRCLDACPVSAFPNPYVLDGSRCLSYHLIESKKKIPEEIRKKNPGYVFGCDICQDVCPHNWKKPLSIHEEFSPAKGIGPYLGKKEVEDLIEHPDKLYGTPLQRRGVAGLTYSLETLDKLDSNEKNNIEIKAQELGRIDYLEKLKLFTTDSCEHRKTRKPES